MGADSKNGTVNLGGKDFNRVERGLDETQVALYISELVKRNQELESSREDTASLHRLAERYVTEADRLAQQIRAEAKERANQECEAIISKAEEEAQKIIDERLAEVMSGAKKRAEQIEAEAMEKAGQKAAVIEAEAEQKAALLLKNGINKVRDELSSIANQEFELLLRELENLQQQTLTAKAKLEQRFAPPKQEPVWEPQAAASTETEECSKEEASDRQKEEQPGQEFSGVVNNEGEEQVEKGEEDGVELVLDIDQPDDAGTQAVGNAVRDTLSYEVEIEPPVDIDMVMKLVAQLDRQGAVQQTEMNLDDIEKPVITVSLKEPADLVGLLEEAAEVTSARVVDLAAGDEEGACRIEVSMSGQKPKQKKGLRANLASLGH